MSDENSVNAALAAFTDPRGRIDIRFGLDRIKQALAILGNPQDKLPPTIHIAGTNGKGSVSAFLRSMAEASDLSVHVFTSPHLIRVNERIRLNGRLVTDEELVDALERVEDTRIDLTYFEALTAAAFLLFSQKQADLCIIETGAGGELDSTNVMAGPSACVITSIGRDHERMFGFSDFTSIARTKAGILRANTPAIIAEQVEDEALASLLQAADEKGADVKLAGLDWKDWFEDEAFFFKDLAGQIKAPWLGLAGPHQRMNAGAACAALRSLGLAGVDADSMAIGLRQVVWPARLQTLQVGPFQQAIGTRIIVDGAHNPAAAIVLAQAIARQVEVDGVKPIALMAMQDNKDAEKIIAAFAPHIGKFIMMPLPLHGGQEGSSGADPVRLAQIAMRCNALAEVTNSLDEAVMRLKALKPDTVYVCGSLYLAGAVLALNEEYPN